MDGSCRRAGVLGIALAQLRQHLGLPGSRPAVAAADAGGSAEGATATCSAADSGRDAGSCLAAAGAADAAAVPSAEPFTTNEVEGMLRRALAGNRAAAGGTLASLARLIQALPSLAMPDLVGAQVCSWLVKLYRFLPFCCPGLPGASRPGAASLAMPDLVGIQMFFYVLFLLHPGEVYSRFAVPARGVTF